MNRLLLLNLLVVVFVGSSDAQDLPVSRVAIVGCHRQDQPAPSLWNYLRAEPQIAIWIGDNVYADTEEDPDYIRRCYDLLAAKPAFQQLRASTVTLATWDDHDYGLNNVGRHYRFKRESKQLFREFWQLESEIPADQQGIWYARVFDQGGQRLQVILLDGRYNRDDPSPTGDTLGEAQWKWLAEQLREPADLRLLVSGYQVLNNPDAGSESWSQFPAARQRLFDTIRAAQAEHLVFLTGDQHYGEVCRLRGALGYDAIELQFAGINQNESPDENHQRVSTVALALHKYALLDIAWERTDTDLPHLLFRVFDAERNSPEVLYRVNFSELETPRP